MGLKFALKDQGLHLYLQLSIYLIAGAMTYLLVVGLTARSLSWQVLELVGLAFPRVNQYFRVREGH
jgi:hypothetical protein